jgi:hypothetical protein
MQLLGMSSGSKRQAAAVGVSKKLSKNSPLPFHVFLLLSSRRDLLLPLLLLLIFKPNSKIVISTAGGAFAAAVERPPYFVVAFVLGIAKCALGSPAPYLLPLDSPQEFLDKL